MTDAPRPRKLEGIRPKPTPPAPIPGKHHDPSLYGCHFPAWKAFSLLEQGYVIQSVSQPGTFIGLSHGGNADYTEPMFYRPGRKEQLLDLTLFVLKAPYKVLTPAEATLLHSIFIDNHPLRNHQIDSLKYAVNPRRRNKQEAIDDVLHLLRASPKHGNEDVLSLSIRQELAFSKQSIQSEPRIVLNLLDGIEATISRWVEKKKEKVVEIFKSCPEI